MTTKFHSLFGNKTIHLEINLNNYRVKFTLNVTFAIVFYAKTSVYLASWFLIAIYCLENSLKTI